MIITMIMIIIMIKIVIIYNGNRCKQWYLMVIK